MSSIRVMPAWKATALSAVMDLPNIAVGGALVAVGEVVPYVTALGAVPLGLALGRAYRAYDRAVEVRTHAEQRARQLDREQRAELTAPVQAAAVREDVEPVATIAAEVRA